MRPIDKLINPPKTLVGCQHAMKEAAHEMARLRSMLFQFLDGGDSPEFRVKVMNVLGVAHKIEYISDRITDDKQFSSLNDEN